MRLRVAAVLLAVLVAGCIRSAAPRAARPDGAPAASTEIRVHRDDERDADVAAQVRRVLPAARAAAERWAPLIHPVAITIHPSHAALEAAARRPGFDWLRAWARADAIELQSPRTWSTGGTSDAEMRELLAHELTHAAMYQQLGGDLEVARTVPLWFREGMASVAAGESHPVIAEWPSGTLRSAAAEYRTASARAYATAHAAFGFLLARHGDAAVRGVLARMAAGQPFPAAFRGATGVGVEEFEAELARSVARPHAA